MRVVACEGAVEDAVGSASGDGAGLVVVAVVDGEGSGAGKVEPSPPPPHFSFFQTSKQYYWLRIINIVILNYLHLSL
jgi:hypothetical protein